MSEPVDVQSAVDRLLLEQGGYEPVELLLLLGALPFNRYEAWRCGVLESLTEVLAAGLDEVLSDLRVAASWAGRLGLEPMPEDYHGWGPNAGRPLVLSAIPEVDRLLRTLYRRPAAGEPQLDLFLDSGPTAALTDLAAALAARDEARARTLLQLLRSRFPRERRRMVGEALTEALARLQGDEVGDPAEEAAVLTDHLGPLARALLGHRAPAFMAPFWRRLGRAVEGGPYDPGRDRLHASHAYAQAMDWEGVRRTALAVDDPEGHPVLLARLATACRRLGRTTDAIGSWCELCWRHPRHAHGALSDPDLPDPLVRRAWGEFLRLDPELETSWFPAWLLVREPGLARLLPATEGLLDGPRRAFNTVRQLLNSPEEGPSGGIALRRALQQESPELLALYLERHVARKGQG